MKKPGIGSDRYTVSTKYIRYKVFHTPRKQTRQQSISPYGLDTEADINGQWFMMCTSEGDTFIPADYPGCFFTRKYRNAIFTCYNLKYDSGALVQHLPIEELDNLRLKGMCKYEGYQYKIIGNKCLSIRKGKNSITVYDLLNFYMMSLDKAAKKYLGLEKIDIGTYEFTEDYIFNHWDKIERYCIYDAVLCKKLTDLIISIFEEYDVFPRKLYSVAYISWVYFRSNCPYIHVVKYWQENKRLLDYSLEAYNGGKFEVTQKGPDYYYEYDIVSAYPNEIRNLVDIRQAQVIHDNKYHKDAVYGFIRCTMDIPHDVYSPIAIKNKGLNVYPVGIIEKVITKCQNEYLL